MLCTDSVERKDKRVTTLISELLGNFIQYSISEELIYTITYIRLKQFQFRYIPLPDRNTVIR